MKNFYGIISLEFINRLAKSIVIYFYNNTNLEIDKFNDREGYKKAL